jgi:hypothetical protein
MTKFLYLLAGQLLWAILDAFLWTLNKASNAPKTKSIMIELPVHLCNNTRNHINILPETTY